MACSVSYGSFPSLISCSVSCPPDFCCYLTTPFSLNEHFVNIPHLDAPKERNIFPLCRRPDCPAPTTFGLADCIIFFKFCLFVAFLAKCGRDGNSVSCSYKFLLLPVTSLKRWGKKEVIEDKDLKPVTVWGLLTLESSFHVQNKFLSIVMKQLHDSLNCSCQNIYESIYLSFYPVISWNMPSNIQDWYF